MDKDTILALSLDIDKYFASLPNTKPEIIVATLTLISYKLKDEKPATADVLSALAACIAEGESCST